jgi:hypothetical protein
MPEHISLKAIVVAGSDQVACSLGEEVAFLHMGSNISYGLGLVGDSWLFRYLFRR